MESLEHVEGLEKEETQLIHCLLHFILTYVAGIHCVLNPFKRCTDDNIFAQWHFLPRLVFLFVQNERDNFTQCSNGLSNCPHLCMPF